MKQRHAKRIISIILAISLVISGITYGGKESTQVARAGVGDVFSVVNGVATIASKVGSAVGNVGVMGNASAGKKALAVLDGILGTNFVVPSTTERLIGIADQVSKVENKVDALQSSVDEINATLNVTNNKLDTMSSRLDKQDDTLAGISDDVSKLTKLVSDQNISASSQISGVSSRLEKLIGNQTEDLKITLFNSTVELQNTMTLLNKLDTYYKSFSGLASVEDTILQDLEAKQKSYENFMAAVNELDNSQEVMTVLEKLSMNYEDSYSALSDSEKAVLDIKVNVSGIGEVKISKFIKDYLTDMYTYMTTTIYSKSSGYISNMYDTVKLMGEYITGDVKDVGNTGVGEIFYQSSMIEKSTNAEVHAAYKNFMGNVLQDYYVTAYLCQLSLGYQVAYESEHDGNVMDIANKKNYMQNVSNQMARVNAYYGYELNNCIQKYDFAGYKDGEYEQYICYYGNTVNAKQGISNWRSNKKSDVYVEAALSDSSLELAVAEEKPLYFYQGLEERTKSVTWTSKDESVAVVNKDGSVTGVSPGDTTIVAVFDSYTLECPVSVMNCYAVKNDTGTSTYNYRTDTYTLASSRSYDYYYGADCYTGNKIVLSKQRVSAGLVEATGLSEQDIARYTWESSNPAVAYCQDGQIILTDDGNCVIHGYRYLESSDVYESIGIPVSVTWDTSSEMESDEEQGLKDYSDYTKISSRADLEALRDNPEGWGPDCKYVLTQDIDLGGDEWAPIGYMYATEEDKIYVPFEGIFEGNGHVIKNYKITEIPYQDKIINTIKSRYKYNSEDDKEDNDVVKPQINRLCLGLFGYVRGGVVSNLKVTGGNINMQACNANGVFKSGKTFECGGSNHTLIMGSKSEICAGLLVGDSDVTCYKVLEELMEGIDGKPPILGESHYDDEKGIWFSPSENEEVSKYTKDMPESIKNLGESNGVYVQYIMLEALKQGEFKKTKVSNCYAEGSISINASRTFAGGLFGICSAGLENSSADVVIKVTNTTGNSYDCPGAVGGLIGQWKPKQNDDLSFCTARADIESDATEAAGGLVGALLKGMAYDVSDCNATEKMIATMDKKELSELGAIALTNISFTSMAFILGEDGGTPGYFDFDLSLEASRNIRIENCQAYGTVKAGGNAGGLIGSKKNVNGEAKYWIEDCDSEKGYSAVTQAVQPNLDITECYVDTDVYTSGNYAAGIIGYTERKKSCDDPEQGIIDNCYIHGDIAAGKVAAGVIACGYSGTDSDKDGDDIAITDVIVACESIKANTAESVAETQAYPVCPSSMTDFVTDTSRIGYYDTIDFAYKSSGVDSSGGSATATSGQGYTLSVTQLNSASTYTKLWNPCFCNLNGLDFTNGVLPSVLDERCFFNTEKARKYYHVGDEFEPLTTGTLYTGTGSKSVGTSDGVTSTTPDMSQPGVRKVTVSYNGQYAKDYYVYIYPVKDSYIKVTEKPVLEQDGDSYSISGGKVGVYLSDGSLSKSVDMADCSIEYKDGYVNISYGNMSTSLKVLKLDSYANQVFGEDEIKQLGTWYYLSGDTVDAGQVVEAEREVPNGETTEIVELLVSSLTEDITINSDMCVFSLYQEVAAPVEYSVSLTSRVTQAGDSTVATLEGGGRFIRGSLVTVTAPEMDGYKLVGWYTADDESEKGYSGTALSTKYVYSFNVYSDTRIVAVYSALDKIALSITGTNFTVNGGAVQTSGSYLKKFRAGTHITLAATGENFAYWMNSSKKIVSTSPTYEFTLVNNINYTPVYKNAANSTAFVEFVSSYGQIMQAQTYCASDDITLPDGPAKIGYIFTGWDNSVQNIKDAITNGKTYVKVSPVYEQNRITHTVTVHYNNDDTLTDAYTNQADGSSMEVAAKDIDGKRFSHWSSDAEGTNILGTSNNYFFTVTCDMTIYANYVAADEQVEQVPVINVTDKYAYVEDGVNKVGFVVNRDVPERYTVEQTGVIYGTNERFAGENAENELVIGGSGVAPMVSSGAERNGVYVLTVKVGNFVDTTIYVRGYITVKDTQSGNIETIYSDISSASFNSLNNVAE